MVAVSVENRKGFFGGIFTRDAVVFDPKTTAKALKKANSIMSVIKIATYCIYHAILHPRTPIELSNPGRVSPVPWWGAVMVIVIGIGVWICGSIFEVGGLTEAARAMVYLPLGNMFGMAVGINSVKASDGKSKTDTDENG